MRGWKGIEYHWGMSRWDRTKSFGHNFPVAFVSAAMAKVATLPMDRFAFVREVRSLSPKWTLDHLFKESTYRRMLHPMAPFLPQWSLILPMNETFRTFCLIREDPGLHPVRTFLCGVFAAAGPTALIHPLELSNSLCTIEAVRTGKNSGLVTNFETRYIQGGKSYLLTGLKSTVIVRSLFAGVLFTSYESMKTKFSPLESNSLSNRTLTAFTASFIASVLTLPFEVSRRELVYQSCHRQRIDTFGHILRSSLNLIPQKASFILLQQVPTMAILLILFEGWKKQSFVSE